MYIYMHMYIYIYICMCVWVSGWVSGCVGGWVGVLCACGMCVCVCTLSPPALWTWTVPLLHVSLSTDGRPPVCVCVCVCVCTHSPPPSGRELLFLLHSELFPLRVCVCVWPVDFLFYFLQTASTACRFTARTSRCSAACRVNFDCVYICVCVCARSHPPPTGRELFLLHRGRWYAPSPRHLRSLLSAGGWFFVWSFVVLFLSCRVLRVCVLVVCLCVWPVDLVTDGVLGVAFRSAHLD